MGPSNVEVADGDAPAINSILDTMMLATTQTQKTQLMAILTPAFKQASCCVGTSANRDVGRASPHECTLMHAQHRVCAMALCSRRDGTADAQQMIDPSDVSAWMTRHSAAHLGGR